MFESLIDFFMNDPILWRNTALLALGWIVCVLAVRYYGSLRGKQGS